MRSCMSCQTMNSKFQDLEAKVEQYKEVLSAKLAFLTMPQPASFSDVVLFADNDDEYPVPVPAHKAILANRSPVLRAMLDNEMKESLSGTIKIGDVSYDVLLRAFVNYLYTAEVCLDQKLACELLVMSEKYEVQHLKDFCQKFLVSNLNLDNSLSTYTFAHQHNFKPIIDAALTLITASMDKLASRDEYTELKERDPRLLLEIYEAYFSKRAN
ncbi:BTB/POZ domain-containing protein [Prunus yedoensis var. nudiflora]|uniref:BTB/POZ domain-containing protein n=1 Tax=Prunus yedoensis var. nudiflora TaxID=2094558 RepID=A0A314YBW8_PRUYE|nr:BTB/POZ domain-containing protein [Prunus yedoensis var. nudiflora]